MTEYKKYQHLERYGTQETEGLLVGDVYIFPKIDGTNGHIWYCDKENKIKFGSRNRELNLENDNAGFMNQFHQDERLINFFKEYPNLRLYGEFLVPHSLKTYRQDAWRRFYVFDVYNKDLDDLVVPYDYYKPVLDQFSIDYISPIQIIKNPSIDNLYTAMEKNGFLIEDGKGTGEGIVLKNYDYYNKYGRQTWGKIITNEFKEVHHKEMGAPIVSGSKIVEQEIVETFVTESFILKEKAKIEVEVGEWNSKLIPRLLGIVFYELVREETWNILRKYKNPKIDFSLLNRLTIAKTKNVLGL